jgi:hypothetical protein
MNGFLRFLTVVASLHFVPAWAESSLVLNVSDPPAGILSRSQSESLWSAYQTAGECMDHPTYGEGRSYRLKVRGTDWFADAIWSNPFEPNSPVSGNSSMLVFAPQPLVKVKLDERYGEENGLVGQAASWFQAASISLRKGATDDSKVLIRTTLLNWAEANALSKGIHVSWGKKPVDWQVMTLINAILTTTAAMAPEFTKEERIVIGPWLNRLVSEVAASSWRNRADNKAYFTAYITTVWAFMASDKAAAQHSVDVTKLAIHDLRPDGSFPIDSQRGGMGLKYSTDSLGYLVMIAALVKANTGQDLFAYDAGGRTMNNAVDFLVSAIKDPSTVNQIYAIPCPESGDRWGSVAKPSLSFIDAAGFLGVYAALNPNANGAGFIRSKYGDGSNSKSRVFSAPPGMLISH